MKIKIVFLIIILYPLCLLSQPDYNFIVSDFDTLLVLQNKDYIEMQGILQSYEISDSTSWPSGAGVLSCLDKTYSEWTELDSLIKRANKLTFSSYTKDHQKISILSKMIDSATYNYKMNLQVLQGICSKYSNFEAEDSLKIRLNNINALKFPPFRPRTIK